MSSPPPTPTLRLRWRHWRHQVLRPWWREAEWFVIGALSVLALVLGGVGFARQGGGEAARPLLDTVYLALQLFTLESGAVPPPVSWQLELARWLAPGVTAFAAFKALAALFAAQIELMRVRFVRDHAIVCGLGHKGLRLAQAFHAQGVPVVVIERDEDHQGIAECREEGIHVLVGAANDKVMLRKAGVRRARYLVAVCGDDGVNAEVAVDARELVWDRPGAVLTAYVHIVDVALCALLREKEIAFQRGDSFRLEFFNVYESGARALFSSFPPFAPDHDGPAPHVLLVGLGRMGGSLAVQAARAWRVVPGAARDRLRVTVVDRDAAQKTELLTLRYPALARLCRFEPVSLDVSSPAFGRGDFLFDAEGRCTIKAIYVCLDDDARGLSAALGLLHRVRAHQVPIVVRMMIQDVGLARLLQGEVGEDPGFKSLHAFGLLDRTCTPELLLRGTHDQLARAIHENYVHHQHLAGFTPATNPSMVPWEALPESLQESNRRHADSMGVKLRAVGCAIAPLADWDAPLLRFTPEEVEQLAELEHDRWWDERAKGGWVYAPGPKDIARKTSPFMVPWDALPEAQRENDRVLVRALPAFLARAGFHVYRLRTAEIALPSVAQPAEG